MDVKNLINTKITPIYSKLNLERVVKQYLETEIDVIPVINKREEVIGLLTRDEILKAVINNDMEIVVEEVMLKEFKTISVNSVLEEIIEQDESIFHQKILPVINNEKKLVGVISPADLFKVFYDFSQEISRELNTILESARNAIIAINNQGIITIFNKAALKIVGIGIADAIGKPVEDVIPGTGLVKVVKTGESQIARKFKIGNTMVISNRSPLIKEGKISGAIGIFQDITDLESISKELKYTRDLNRELDTIIEAVSDGLYITDGQGYTTRINSTYEKISGIKAEEVIGHHMQELVDEGYYSESVTLHVLKERKPVTITHKIRTGIEVMVTGIPVYDDDGNIVRVVTTVRDMEALYKMKQELKESKNLTARYFNELEQLRLQQLELEDVIVQNTEMKEIIKLAARLGQFSSTVLISGESGVGKEIVASIIHKSSQSLKNESGSLIKVNCGAIPENLIESELFGYEKGAFTGAKKEGKPGLFELAENGTLFLDEIAELPLRLQAKFLRAIQEREFLRIGGTKAIQINTRILAATNKDLDELVKKEKFREDLFYRLNVVPIYVPPLRERKEDVGPLILYFLRIFNEKFKTNKKLSLELLSLLENYDWPGNVRQLKNIIERLVVMVPDDIITETHLPADIKNTNSICTNQTLNLTEVVAQIEKEIITKAMKKVSTTREIASLLGVSQPTVVRRLKKYNLKPK